MTDSHQYPYGRAGEIIYKALAALRRFFWYSTPMPTSFVRRLLRLTLRAAVILLCFGFVLSAFSGHVSPVSCGGYWGTLLLSFPLWLSALLIAMLITLWADRRFFLLCVACVLVSWDAVTDYCPMNPGFTHPRPDPESVTFTMMTYNVSSFCDMRTGKIVRSTTPIMEYILSKDVDILCLQETEPMNSNGFKYFDRALLDSLFTRYPYRIFGASMQGILSKYPIERIPIDSASYKESGDVIGVIADIGGVPVSLFDIHLMSLGLSESDRELYRDLTGLKRESIGDVRTHLLSKISLANVRRERQAEFLVNNIRKFATPTAVVCGDFNDVTGCYSMNLLEREGFRDVYSEVGFGPMITFNARRFYFCIDHVMYRGRLRPLKMDKGKSRVSDHYPLVATFELTE